MTKISNPMELPEMVFPKDAFPKSLVEIMDQFHEKLNLNYDYLGTSLIYALSLAIGNSVKLRVRKKWIESPIVWAIIVGSAGINKTSPLDLMIEPFKTLDRENFRIYEKELSKFRILQNSKGKKRSKDTQVENIDAASFPKRIQNLITDFTPEALSEAHECNIKGIGIYADELLLWINNFNRYTKSGEEQFYLSTWSGKEISINRRSSPHFYIPFPFIPVAGTIQPYKLAEAFGKGKDKSGFTHRMLFAYPDNVKREALSDDDIPDVYINTYSNIILNIMNLSKNAAKDGEVKPIYIDLNEDAQSLFKEWREINNSRINSGSDEDIKGIFSKSEIYLLRLSLILQIAQDVCENKECLKVTAAAFSNAMKLIEYYEFTAIKVNKLISRFCDPLANYSMDKRMVYTALPIEFNTAKGESVATQLNMPRRTFFDFLKDSYLFEKQRHGNYLKKV